MEYKLEVHPDSGNGKNRIVAHDEKGFAFFDTGERNSSDEDFHTTLKALYFAIERIAELERENDANRRRIMWLLSRLWVSKSGEVHLPCGNTRITTGDVSSSIDNIDAARARGSSHE